jgi:hypothetical protein
LFQLFLEGDSVDESKHPFAQKARADFRLKEFEILRKEIEYRTVGQERVERNVVVAVIAMYAWLALVDVDKLQGPLKEVYPYLWWLPFFIVVLGGARFWDDHIVIGNIGAYIARLEKIVDKRGGWENSEERNAKRIAPYITWFLRKGTWLFLIFGTAAIAIYFRVKM